MLKNRELLGGAKQQRLISELAWEQFESSTRLARTGS
ncbi:hypothetical protein GGQ84_002281 [Desulfitispora alkaliphila]